MKIEEIKKQKNGKYKITFESGEVLNTYDDVILNNGLLFHKDVDSLLFNKLNEETKYYDIYNKTIKYIEKKLRSKKEIEVFLDKNEIGANDKKKIIDKLESINLINDKLFANAYFQDRINLSSDGPYKIINELKKNNISDDIILSIEEKIDNDAIYEKLSKLVLKKIKSNRNKSNYMLKQKIVVDMINLGYEKNIIIDIINENIDNNNSVIQNEYKKLFNKLSKKYDDEELNRMIKNKLIQKGFSLEEINKIEK